MEEYAIPESHQHEPHVVHAGDHRDLPVHSADRKYAAFDRYPDADFAFFHSMVMYICCSGAGPYSAVGGGTSL